LGTPDEYYRLLREWLALGPLDERAYWWFVSLMLGAEPRHHARRIRQWNQQTRRRHIQVGSSRVGS
jgi:hypothetical protein